MSDDSRRRAPLLAVGLISMAIAAWLGLLRLGWNLPTLAINPVLHGPLMVCGFLGTVISLERAIALAARWSYAAPILAGAGAIAAVIAPSSVLGSLLILGGSVGLVMTTLVICVRQPSLFIVTILLGAATWCIGNGLWLGGRAMIAVVPWWLAFLVLTIAGERLELNRVFRPPARVRASFIAAVFVALAGLVLSLRLPTTGSRIFGVALIGLALWLARYDLARRTVRQRGLTRYMAVALLSGYVWLSVGGVLATIYGVTAPGLLYDATLHAVFLGFVMSMVFAHAPIIFPAVLGRPLPYRPVFYLHLGILHASLLLRVAGDLVGAFESWRAWGGLLNAIAIVVFVANIGRSLLLAGRIREEAPLVFRA